MYTRVSESYINAMLDKSVSSLIGDICYNLSAVLCDIDGRITQSASKNILKTLNMTTGLVILGEEAPSIQELSTLVVPIEGYTNMVSNHAYSLYLLLKSSDSSLVATSSTEVSSMLTLSEQLSPSIKNTIDSIYLEALAVYQECIGCTLSTGLSSITQQDLSRMDTNIRWVSSYLEYSDKAYYDLIEVLRDLQRALVHLRSINKIFTVTYTDKLRQLNEWRGV